jgi:hypothetical protein
MPNESDAQAEPDYVVELGAERGCWVANMAFRSLAHEEPLLVSLAATA